MDYRYKYGKNWYTCLDLSGFKYWTMGFLINDKNGNLCTILINKAHL